MKTTIDIPANELRDAIRFTKAKTKREAILKVLDDFNRRKRIAELCKYGGTSESMMTSDELMKMRECAPTKPPRASSR